MEPEAFPVGGFEFMDEPATDDQKDAIVKIAKNAGHDIDRNGQWPTPFSKWDAYRMIETLRDECIPPGTYAGKWSGDTVTIDGHVITSTEIVRGCMDCTVTVTEDGTISVELP